MTQESMPSPASFAGRCRAVLRPNEYMILPEDTRCSIFLPNLTGGKAQVLATPQLGARFTACELRLSEHGGTEIPTGDALEHFLFVLEGRVELVRDATGTTLEKGGYASMPPGMPYGIKSKADGTRVFWFRRRYEKLKDVQLPEPIVGNEASVPVLLSGDINPEQRLIPRSPSSDMAFNIIHVEPGAFYGMVESHAWEHAMYMLAGEGLLALNGEYHHVRQNDFIYIAPYCPEFFCTLGQQGASAKFLLYWDTMRDYSVGL